MNVSICSLLAKLYHLYPTDQVSELYLLTNCVVACINQVQFIWQLSYCTASQPLLCEQERFGYSGWKTSGYFLTSVDSGYFRFISGYVMYHSLTNKHLLNFSENPRPEVVFIGVNYVTFVSGYDPSANLLLFGVLLVLVILLQVGLLLAARLLGLFLPPSLK